MSFGMEITELIRAVGVLGIAGIIFAESGLLLGFFLPGDTLLFSAGFLATKDVFGMSVHSLVAILIVAAIAGEAVGYWFGHKVGRHIFRRKNSLLFHPENLERAERFYQKYGPITVMLARFVPVVRTFVPIVAGAARMDLRVFTIYNVAGALLWVAGLTYLGYFLGAFFEERGIHIDNFILPIIGLVTLFTLLSPLLHIIKEPQSRADLLQKLGFKKNN